MPISFSRTASSAALPLSLALCLAATGAGAHALLERKEAQPNAAYRGVLQIMHGCDGSPTTRVSVTVPEGVTGAKPMPKPGWEVTTTRGAYAKSYPSFHGQVSEGVKTITWSGGTLPDDQVDEFTFFGRISGDFAPGSTVYFPVEQVCATGSLRWSEVPGEGQDAHALKTPAPGVRIAGAAPAVKAASASAKAGEVAIVAPWLRATPGGAKVGAGYLTLTNGGAQADRLVGVSIPQAGRAEIHSMAMEGGVMRMAPVEGGLRIEPGQTVELKPGGYHLMFQNLTAPFRAGERVKGSLTFERAGAVAVEFRVEPIGAAGPAGGGHDHH